ncbi:MAG: ABC transporter permease [Brevundimonas sp.]|uniref:ABC transporter permease n=1 Tax=Brevundimonas sp. TaxID=1871086 RepID=UPI0027324625|nr:ABC transporter permease [Brevundimonas sp.]MDP3379587.1 ABC transporter permease [Brevundimonas sp.]
MATADFEIDSQGKGVRLRLVGDWTAAGLSKLRGRLGPRLRKELGDAPVTTLDLTDLGRFDTTGALVLSKAVDGALPEGAWEGRPEVGRVYDRVQAVECNEAAPLKRPSALTRSFAKVGRGMYDIGGEALLSMAFLGRLITATGAALRHPGRIRWPAWVSQIERAGLDAIPIVAVTAFFIGAVVAFIGADLLQQFGFDVFAVELIAISVLREFAVVIAAILLAGRSSSSFAAEVGAMKMNQEIDAMQVMGVNPFQALVIPRLAAMIIMLPLLTFIAMLAGLFGGALVAWSQLDLGLAFFVQRMSVIPDIGNHLFVGLVKAPVFAIVVAAIGCRQGMAVSGDVESLGRRVTAAVVQAIFAIIFLDAVFALIFLELNI